jgi:uncharacterized protein (TIGR00730 family)
MPTNPPPLDSAPLAYNNSEFIDSPDGRILRILAEYQEPLARFRRERIADTIVFFGSARFSESGPASDPASDPVARSHYNDARTLARLVSEWTQTLPGPRHRFVITSGGGPGIMEAANRGAYDAGAKTIGLNIKLPFEQHPNPYITPDLNFEFHYFFMRKFWFAYLAKALVVFPGGFGTMDEMFEILTLAQTQKLEKPLAIIIYDTAYWKSVVNFDLLATNGAIAPADLNLFQFADTPEQALALLQSGLAQHIELPGHPDEREIVRPDQPLPSAQDLLGPDINKTRS